MVTASGIISSVRQLLDQVPTTNEDVKTDSAIIGSPSTNFSDENLLTRINRGERQIVTRVKAQHVPSAITRYTGPFPVISNDVIRILHSRVMYTGTDENNVTWATYDPSGYYAGSPSNNEILYTLVASRKLDIQSVSVSCDTNPSGTQTLTVYKNGNSQGQINLEANGSHTDTMSQFYMSQTDVLTVRADSNIDAEGITLNFTADAEIITAASVNDARAVQRSVDRHRRNSRSGRQATASYPVYTYEDGELRIYPDSDNAEVYIVEAPTPITLTDLANSTDELTIDERLEGALIYHVAASCYQTERQPGLYDWANSMYQSEIQPYMLENRMNARYDDREVDVE